MCCSKIAYLRRVGLCTLIRCFTIGRLSVVRWSSYLCCKMIALSRYVLSNVRIDNSLALLAAIFGFFGTLIASIDKFPNGQDIINRTSTWSDIQYAIGNLEKFENPTPDTINPSVRKGTRGFERLVEIIKANRADLRDVDIVFLYIDSPMAFGDMKFKIVNMGVRSPYSLIWPDADMPLIESKQLTFEYSFRDWLTTYRQRFFLSWGLRITAFGFFLAVLSRLKIKTKSI